MKSIIHLDCANWHVNIYFFHLEDWCVVGLSSQTEGWFHLSFTPSVLIHIHLSWILWKAENPPDGRRNRVVMIFSVGRLEGMRWWGRWTEQSALPCWAKAVWRLRDAEYPLMLLCTYILASGYMALQIFIVSHIKIQAVSGPDKFNSLTDVGYDTLLYVGSFYLIIINFHFIFSVNHYWHTTKL